MEIEYKSVLASIYDSRPRVRRMPKIAPIGRVVFLRTLLLRLTGPVQGISASFHSKKEDGCLVFSG